MFVQFWFFFSMMKETAGNGHGLALNKQPTHLNCISLVEHGTLGMLKEYLDILECFAYWRVEWEDRQPIHICRESFSSIRTSIIIRFSRETISIRLSTAFSTCLSLGGTSLNNGASSPVPHFCLQRKPALLLLLGPFLCDVFPEGHSAVWPCVSEILYNQIQTRIPALWTH